MRTEKRCFLVSPKAIFPIPFPSDDVSPIAEAYNKVILDLPLRHDIVSFIRDAYNEEVYNTGRHPQTLILSGLWYLALDGYDLRTIGYFAVVVDHLMDDGMRFLMSTEVQVDKYLRRKFDEQARPKSESVRKY